MLDLPYPKIDGENSEKKIAQINNYLIQLKDAIEFAIAGMSDENKSMADALAKNLNASIEEREDELTQFSSKVSKKIGNEEIISSINQTAEEVKIDASKISLEGLVTVNGNFQILENGSAVFTSDSEVWILPTAYDVDRIQDVALGRLTVSGDLLKAMDFNCDGEVGITDFIAGKAILLGKESIDHYVNTFGYQKQTSKVTLKILPDDAEKTILISGINSFGSYVESYFGLNVSKADQVRSEGANIGKLFCGEIETSSGNNLDTVATRLATVEAQLGISS